MADAGLNPQDVAAAVGARRDLGPEYDDVIAASLVDHMEKEIAARVNAQLAAKGIPATSADPRFGPYQNPYSPPARRPRDGGVALPITSMALGVPITAIAGATGGHNAVLAIAVTWLGIGAVNFAHAWGRRRER